MIAMTPVTVNWLVTVNGWAPTRANGIMPIRLANRMNMKTVNTQGTYLRPSGPMLVVSIEVTKPVTPSTATCQRPGTSSRFIPPSMNSQISAEDDQHPQRAVGEDERGPVQIARERADLELVHRVDLAFGRHSLASLGPSFGLLLRNLPNFPHGGAEPEEQHRHPDTQCVPASRSITQPIRALPSG